MEHFKLTIPNGKIKAAQILTAAKLGMFTCLETEAKEYLDKGVISACFVPGLNKEAKFSMGWIQRKGLVEKSMKVSEKYLRQYSNHLIN